MAFASGSDMVLRFDVRRLGQFLSDSGVPIADGSVASNATLAALLEDASEMVAMAALMGKRYTRANLNSIANGSNREQIVRIVCNLCFGLVMQRRGYSEEEIGRQAAGYKEALRIIEDLRIGAQIFDIEAVAIAGVDVIVPEPSATVNANLLSSQRRIFGRPCGNDDNRYSY